jgi:GMP synthase (glutamine-hydrolysing)
MNDAQDDRPVLILQHLDNDGPAYLATWLGAQGVPYRVFNTQAGQDFPASVRGHRALAVLGGEISANDDLPSLRQAEHLIREAIERDVPVLGHCLGGQLMAKALGARIVPSPAPEVGWHAMAVADTALAQAWFGSGDEPRVFHWHFEAFDLPPGAVGLAHSEACPHQAFAVGERHLAMQFHVEIDAAKLAAWSTSKDPAYLSAQREWPSVHDGARMRAEAASALPAQQGLADCIYTRWLG